MDEKLRVTLQVSTPVTGSFGAKRNVLLDFTGETELTLPELRKVLSHVVTGVPVLDVRSFLDVEEELGMSSDEEEVSPAFEVTTGTLTVDPAALMAMHVAESSVTPTSPKTRRRKPRGKTPLVCQRCGRPFKGLSKLQKYCHKKDCEAVAAANFVAESVRAVCNSQRGVPKNYPKTRMSPTPRTPATCQRCGRNFVAYTKLQKYCGKDDCFEVAALSTGQTWTPQVTIEAGKGVMKGAV